METLGRVIAAIICYLFFDTWLCAGKEFMDWPTAYQVIYVVSLICILYGDEK